MPQISNHPASWLQLDTPQSLLDGLLDFYPVAVTDDRTLYDLLLQEICWQSGFITLYGKRHPLPRLQAWVADEHLSYWYSGEQWQPMCWTPTLIRLRDELNSAFGLTLNSVLCNLYRNGQDAMGWHSDDEPELGAAARIISLSLGAERDFALRQQGSSRQYGCLSLPSGSLLDMKPGMQSHWQHAVPRRQRISQPRINLTFRQIISLSK